METAVAQAPSSTKFRMEGRRVLLVDAALQPISIVTWEHAFNILYADKELEPRVVVYSSDGAVIGVHRNIRVPSVVQLGNVVPRHRQRVRFCRKNVLVGRDRGVCQYCGERFMTNDLTLDHVVPRRLGGKTTWENVVAACVPCNQGKGGRTPEQAKMKLIRKPVRPHTIIDVSIKMNLDRLPDEWRDYWDVALTER